MNDTLSLLYQRERISTFASHQVSETTLFSLLKAAHSTTTLFDLQPWVFIVVDDRSLLDLLSRISGDSALIKTAPMTVVFAADPTAWKTHGETLIKAGVAGRYLSEKEACARRKAMHHFFDIGPFGVIGFLKRVADPLIRFLRPSFTIPFTAEDLASHASIHTAAALRSFTIAARSEGLATEPIFTFDRERVKRLLGIPSRFTVTALVPLGYPQDPNTHHVAPLLPLEEKIRFNIFSQRLAPGALEDL